MDGKVRNFGSDAFDKDDECLRLRDVFEDLKRDADL